MSDAAKLVKSNQEQAVAAWMNYLNQLRLDNLLSTFRQQDVNLQDALTSIDRAFDTIRIEIVENGRGRGGPHGTKGFIAEIAEVGVGNARNQILGEGAVYEWVNDNGPVDLVRGGVEIQQKFYAGDRLGLSAVAAHLRTYPDFVKNGGRYQLPRDQYEVIRKLYVMLPHEAGRLTRSAGGPSFADWEWIHRFFDQGAVPFESLEPSNLAYSEVQKGAYVATLDAEKDSLCSTDQTRRDNACLENRPTLAEGAMATASAAAVEGGTAFVLAVVAKRRDGTKLQDFTSEAWIEIANDTGFGVVKGGVRGLSIYSLMNFTATSAAVASSIVTAGFGIAEQAHKLRRGDIDELEFIENAELVALEAAVSALSSFVGQALIPVPVLGAVIGNTVGTVMYQAVSSSLSQREAELIARYIEEQSVLDEHLAAEYQELVNHLDHSMADYLGVLERAFSPDVAVALLGSVELARELGVASEDILDSQEKVLAYFRD